MSLALQPVEPWPTMTLEQEGVITGQLLDHLRAIDDRRREGGAAASATLAQIGGLCERLSRIDRELQWRPHGSTRELLEGRRDPGARAHVGVAARRCMHERFVYRISRARRRPDRLAIF